MTSPDLPGAAGAGETPAAKAAGELGRFLSSFMDAGQLVSSFPSLLFQHSGNDILRFNNFLGGFTEAIENLFGIVGCR